MTVCDVSTRGLVPQYGDQNRLLLPLVDRLSEVGRDPGGVPCKSNRTAVRGRRCSAIYCGGGCAVAATTAVPRPKAEAQIIPAREGCFDTFSTIDFALSAIRTSGSEASPSRECQAKAAEMQPPHVLNNRKCMMATSGAKATQTLLYRP
jgi:hypothetical protein